MGYFVAEGPLELACRRRVEGLLQIPVELQAAGLAFVHGRENHDVRVPKPEHR